MTFDFSSVFITGSTGFVGKNIISYFKNNINYNIYTKNSKINIKEDVVLHLAGKAHDLYSNINFREYYIVNTELTKNVFDSFLKSNAKVFITMSSVKAAADNISEILYEDSKCNPKTHYGKSKLNAEKYIFSKKIPKNKRVYILRPCMIHGPGNKGNLNLLYKFISLRIPWPFGVFKNKRSFCSIDNLLFAVDHLIKDTTIPSGIFNIADDKPLSTNEIVSLICESRGIKPFIINFPREIIYLLARIGDFIKLPINSERINKLTESYLVSNKKLIKSLGKKLPVESSIGMLKTFKSFNNN